MRYLMLARTRSRQYLNSSDFRMVACFMAIILRPFFRETAVIDTMTHEVLL